MIFFLILTIPSYAVVTTVQLLPNTTYNLAYKNTTAATNCNSWTINTAFTDENYNSTNISDGNWYHHQLAIPKLSARCSSYMFTFNLTAYGMTTTNIYNLTIGHVGYFVPNDDGGYSAINWFNNASASWVDGGNLNEFSDTQKTLFFSNMTNLTNAWNSTSGLAKFGLMVACLNTYTGATVCHSYTNIAYINITYEPSAPPPSNTCTYSGSGNWEININDNCTLSSANTLTGSVYIYGSNGYLNFGANQLAHGFYRNYTSGTWVYNNYRRLY
jgi:hypothetical protein